MPASYRVYVDESGDEGFAFLPNERGSSRWLVLSAAVFRKSRDLHAVSVMRSVREALGKPPGKALHFRELKHEQRIPLVRAIAGAPLRAVSILIHKPSIVEPEIFQNEPHRLYRYATRLLLERVSWLCRDNRVEGEGDGSAELIFSNRSAMSYQDLGKYLDHLHAQHANGVDIRIDWSVIRSESVRAVNHDQLAGLQIADAVASGVYQAVNLNQYGDAEPRYLQTLRPILYRHKGTASGYGLKVWPVDLAGLCEHFPHLAAVAAVT